MHFSKHVSLQLGLVYFNAHLKMIHLSLTRDPRNLKAHMCYIERGKTEHFFGAFPSIFILFFSRFTSQFVHLDVTG